MAELIRAVLLDAVGTLIHPIPGVGEVYAAAGRRFGSRRDAATIQVRFRQAFARHDGPDATNERSERTRWRSIVTDVFDDVSDDIEGLFRELWDHFADPSHWALYDDVLPAWQSLRARNLVVGIASNFDARLHAICRAIQPLNDADHVFCSSRIGFQKPHPGFYAHAFRELGIPPQQILMVGDNLANDVEAARAAGCQAVWIQRDGAADRELAVAQLTDLTQHGSSFMKR